MSAHAKYLYFIFWKGTLLNDPDKYLDTQQGSTTDGMAGFGKITKMDDLPPDEVIRGFLEQAMELNDQDVKVTRPPRIDPIS
jgi:hypothetical protein